VKKIPSLSLPSEEGSCIIEKYKSNGTWGGVLLEKNVYEEVFSYASGSFHVAKLKYPSSDK
jgi:hypothetical protein